MVFCEISKDIKDWAADLYSHGFIPDDVCYLLKISPRSLSRWVHNQEACGFTVSPLTYLAGHLCILNSEEVLLICKQLNKAPEMYLDEIWDGIAFAMQASILKITLSKLIQDVGFLFKMLHKVVSE